jgi:hypothetical protein
MRTKGYRSDRICNRLVSAFILFLSMYSFQSICYSQQVVQDFELIENGGFEATAPPVLSSGTFVHSAPPWNFMVGGPNVGNFKSFLFSPDSYFNHSEDCSDQSEILFKYNVKSYVQLATIQVPTPWGYQDDDRWITSFNNGANEFGFQSPNNGRNYAGVIYSNEGFTGYTYLLNCGQIASDGGGTGCTCDGPGRIAIPLKNPLDPCKQYSFSAWVSKMESLENDDDPKIKVLVAHDIQNDLSPVGGSQVIDSWQITDATSWVGIPKTFKPDDNYDWLVLEMDNGALPFDHKTSGLYIDDVSLTDVCKQQYFCDDKTVDNLDMVYVSHTVVHAGTIPQYATISNLEYATSMDIKVETTGGTLVYQKTNIVDPAFNYRWAHPGNLSFGLYEMTVTVYNRCCSRTITVPILIQGDPGPYPNNQEHFARAPLQCCRPYIILDNTTLSGNQVFKAIDGVIVQNNVICSADANVALIAGDYVEVNPGVVLTPNTTLEIVPCPKSTVCHSCNDDKVVSHKILPKQMEMKAELITEVYPNSVSVGDRINVSVSPKGSTTVDSTPWQFKVQVFATTGQEVYSSSWGDLTISSPITINTENWASGVYVVHVLSGEGLLIDMKKLFVGN